MRMPSLLCQEAQPTMMLLRLTSPWEQSWMEKEKNPVVKSLYFVPSPRRGISEFIAYPKLQTKRLWIPSKMLQPRQTPAYIVGVMIMLNRHLGGKDRKRRSMGQQQKQVRKKTHCR